MSELMIGNGYLTNQIFIGKVRKYKDGHQEWSGERKEVTKEAVACVIEHIRIMEEKDGKCYRIKIKDKVHELRLVEVEDE